MSKEIISILVFDLSIIIIPILLHLFPPKDINYVFGYRTKRSTRNIEDWKFSQKYFSKQWIFASIIVVTTQLLLIFISDIDLKMEPPIIPIISMIEFFVGSIFCYFSTEIKLKKWKKSNNYIVHLQN